MFMISFVKIQWVYNSDVLKNNALEGKELVPTS